MTQLLTTCKGHNQERKQLVCRPTAATQLENRLLSVFYRYGSEQCPRKILHRMSSIPLQMLPFDKKIKYYYISHYTFHTPLMRPFKCAHSSSVTPANGVVSYTSIVFKGIQQNNTNIKLLSKPNRQSVPKSS